MHLFIDSANLEDITWGLKSGFVKGVTTNPSILAKEPKGNYLEHLKKIVGLLDEHIQPADKKNFSLSVEVFSDEPCEMVKQTEEFISHLQWPGLAIKIHINRGGRDNLAVINQLSRNGIDVNCTACMTVYQAMGAAAAGAKYVSLFWGRIRDGGLDEKFSEERTRLIREGKLQPEDFDPVVTVRETRNLLDRFHPNVKIIAGSIRQPADIKDAALAGAHIVTVQPKILRAMLSHFKTDEVVDQFFNDFKEWMS
jgi:transaldolase